MSRYWTIAPIAADPREHFDKVWGFDLANNSISIGWSELGDVSQMSRDELTAAVAFAYPEKPPAARGLCINMIWAFFHEISPGDFVIARRGRKILAGVGKVTQSAYFDSGKNSISGHLNFIGVSWQENPRDTVFPSIVFPMYTVAEIQEEKFYRLIHAEAAPGHPLEISELADSNESSAFVLEKYLEEFMVSNFQTIFKGDMKIYQDGEGNDGQQFATEVGPIDILAFEPKSKSFVVIELKKGRPSDQVVGQVLRYMGWVKTNLCRNGETVKGLVVCREPDSKLSYALQMTNGIDIRYYDVAFKLMEAPITSAA